MRFLYKLFKIIISFSLIPFCLGSIIALWQVIILSGHASTIWSMFFVGVFFWVLIYIFLPEPKWLYVLGHESTHAIWSLLFGGKLKKIKVRSDGGHVLITKSNFLITLAPYFFPFYSVLIFIIYAISNIFWNLASYVSIFYLLIGLTYAFHITLTYKILKIKQPDIVHEGYIFSAVIIILGNMLILLIGIPLLTTKVTLGTSMNLWINYSNQIYHYIFQII